MWKEERREKKEQLLWRSLLCSPSRAMTVRRMSSELSSVSGSEQWRNSFTEGRGLARVTATSRPLQHSECRKLQCEKAVLQSETGCEAGVKRSPHRGCCRRRRQTFAFASHDAVRLQILLTRCEGRDGRLDEPLQLS